MVYKEDLEEVASISVDIFNGNLSCGKLIYTHWSNKVWLVIGNSWLTLCDKEGFLNIFDENKGVLGGSKIIINGDEYTIFGNMKVEWKENE